MDCLDQEMLPNLNYFPMMIHLVRQFPMDDRYDARLLRLFKKTKTKRLAIKKTKTKDKKNNLLLMRISKQSLQTLASFPSKYINLAL